MLGGLNHCPKDEEDSNQNTRTLVQKTAESRGTEDNYPYPLPFRLHTLHTPSHISSTTYAHSRNRRPLSSLLIDRPWLGNVSAWSLIDEDPHLEANAHIRPDWKTNVIQYSSPIRSITQTPVLEKGGTLLYHARTSAYIRWIEETFVPFENVVSYFLLSFWHTTPQRNCITSSISYKTQRQDATTSL